MKAKLNSYRVEWTMTGQTVVRATSPEEAKEKWEELDGPYQHKFLDSFNKSKHSMLLGIEAEEASLIATRFEARKKMFKAGFELMAVQRRSKIIAAGKK